MNLSGTLGTAILRGIYQGVGQFGLTTLLTYQVTGNWSDALVAGGIAGLIALGFRGGVEGLADRSRQQAGDVRASDIQAGSNGKA